MIFLTQAVYAVCVQQTTIFYINGVDNTGTQAEKSRQRLQDALILDKRYRNRSDCTTVKLAYNKSENRIADLSEALRQRTLEAGLTATNFWEMWERLIPSQNWFVEAFRTAMSTEQVLYDARDPKILAQINEHIDTLYRLEPTGNQLLFAAHSQGNFFGNEERLGLLERFPQIGARVKMVSIATPSDNVAGDIKPYTTLTEDKLINNNFVAALPALTTNGDTGGECDILPLDEWICHSFIDSYMVPESKSRKEIVDNIIATAFPTATIIGTVRDIGGGLAGGATVSLFSSPGILVAETVATQITATYRFDNVPAPCPNCFVKAKNISSNVCASVAAPVNPGDLKVADITLGFEACDALPSVQYLRLTTGNPGVPGDGVLVDGEGRLQDTFEMEPHFSLQGVTNGITVSVFPPSDVLVQNFNLVVSFSVKNKPITQCGTAAGVGNRLGPTVNGVASLVGNFPQTNLNFSVNAIKSLPGCSDVTVGDLLVSSVVMFEATNLTRVLHLDAIAIGIGENVFPTSATPAP